MSSTTIRDLAFADLTRELDKTRKVLERLPDDKFGWKVHDKSMSLGNLALHCANLVEWLRGTIADNGLDMNSPPSMPREAKDRSFVLQTFDKNVAALKSAMATIDDAGLSRPWTLRQGGQELYTNTKAFIARVWCLNHLVHHRAQLCVYLRMHNIPVPSIYFNSADEPEWSFD
jgi:uncharacterized damage-inducible protein DinB